MLPIVNKSELQCWTGSRTAEGPGSAMQLQSGTGTDNSRFKQTVRTEGVMLLAN